MECRRRLPLQPQPNQVEVFHGETTPPPPRRNEEGRRHQRQQQPTMPVVCPSKNEEKVEEEREGKNYGIYEGEERTEKERSKGRRE